SKFAVLCAKNVETGIAKGRNGVENGKIQPVQCAEGGNKPYAQQNCADTLKQKRPQKDSFYHLSEAVKVGTSCRKHQYLSAVKPHFFAEHAHCQRNKGHKAQSACLNQRQNDNLPEKRPVSTRVVGYKTGNAGCRCGHKQSIYVG